MIRDVNRNLLILKNLYNEKSIIIRIGRGTIEYLACPFREKHEPQYRTTMDSNTNKTRN